MTKRIAMTVAAFLLLAGCAGVELSIPGVKSEHMQLINTGLSAVSSASREITDDEEYYIGRGVAARILASASLAGSTGLTTYVNEVGQLIAFHSDRPVTYGGYHFAVISGKEPNAFAAPGGLILITRGMLDLAKDEDELAAILAHEVAHVSYRHGIQTISSSRWSEALAIIGSEAAKTYGSQDIAKLTGIFEGSVDDVVKTLVVKGYGRSQENESDRSAIETLGRAGYDPAALVSFLKRLASSGKGGTGGILATHPGIKERISQAEQLVPADSGGAKYRSQRAQRFARGLL